MDEEAANGKRQTAGGITANGMRKRQTAEGKRQKGGKRVDVRQTAEDVGLPLIAHCPLPIACRLPSAVCRLPFAVCRLPPAVCRLPFADSSAVCRRFQATIYT